MNEVQRIIVAVWAWICIGIVVGLIGGGEAASGYIVGSLPALCVVGFAVRSVILWKQSADQEDVA